jgi:hypothetical protein
MTAPRAAWRRVSVPAPLAAMRSMLTHEERQYLVWLAAERIEGWGAVIDLGAWLGSSSAALAEGFRRAGRPLTVQSFDRFIWEVEPGHMSSAAGLEIPGGADFLPVFLHEIGEYAPWITARRADLTDYAWTEGPIEVLFVDAAKSWELVNAILAGFAHALVPGKSRVVLQDYRLHDAYWLPLIFESRPDLWAEAEAVSDGTTVTFIPRRDLTAPDALPPRYTDDDFPLPLIEQLIRSRMARESPTNARRLLHTLLRRTVADGTAEEWRAVRQEAILAGATAGELAEVEDPDMILVPRGWKEYERGHYAEALAIAERCLADRKRRSAWAVALAGMSHLRLGDLALARRCIDEVVTRMPGAPEPWLHRGEVALAERLPRQAEACAVRALRVDGPRAEHVDAYAISLLAWTWHEHPRSHDRGPTAAFLAARQGTHGTLLDALIAHQRAEGWHEDAEATLAASAAFLSGRHPHGSTE